MIVKKHIKVLVSVAVIFTMMLHMVIPHAHHHHEKKEEIAHSHAKHNHAQADDHDHSHGHNHDTEKDNSQISFSFPAKKHLHAFHIHEFVNASKNRNLQLPEKTLPFQSTINSTNSYLQTKNKQSYSFVFFRRIIYDNPFIKHCSLRAPPEIA